MHDAAIESDYLPIYREELSQALNFTAADLQENRAGVLASTSANSADVHPGVPGNPQRDVRAPGGAN